MDLELVSDDLERRHHLGTAKAAGLPEEGARSGRAAPCSGAYRAASEICRARSVVLGRGGASASVSSDAVAASTDPGAGDPGGVRAPSPPITRTHSSPSAAANQGEVSTAACLSESRWL